MQYFSPGFTKLLHYCHAIFCLSRPLWQHYYRNTDAVIYVVDSSDRERFDEAKDELWDMIKDDRLRDCSLLILANKQVVVFDFSLIN